MRAELPTGSISVRFSVVFEDNHVLVVNKSAGLATMGTTADQPSLAREIQADLKRRYHKPGNVYLGIVSRLDSVTSGLIVFAKTSKAAGRLTTQFQKREVKKWYLAAVPSVARVGASAAPEPDAAWDSCWHAHWEDVVWKDETARRMRTRKPGSGRSERRDNAPDSSGDSAALRWRQLGRGESFDLILVQLLTGRKHQIRVQFADRGFPLLGDRKYGSRDPFPEGIALHSWRLEFQHPVSRQRLHFCQGPPNTWRALGPVEPWADLRSGLENSPRIAPAELIARLAGFFSEQA
jgi:23S rRNA pseudouridine1911/1915/1917 synthase